MCFVSYKEHLGHVVDEDELHEDICKIFIKHHTWLGDLVVDLCSGSGALAVTAFSHGRSVIAVEVNTTHFQTILNHICPLVTITNVDEEEKNTDTEKQQTIKDSKSFETTVETTKEDNPTCIHCAKEIDIPADKETCSKCHALLHPLCATQELNGEKLVIFCSMDCDSLSIPLFNFFKLFCSILGGIP